MGLVGLFKNWVMLYSKVTNRDWDKEHFSMGMIRVVLYLSNHHTFESYYVFKMFTTQIEN